MSSRRIRTTITLPMELLDAADQAVREGRARSRNELLVAALHHELAARERAAIDAAFTALANDTEFHEVSVALAEENMPAGWAAFRVGENGK